MGSFAFAIWDDVKKRLSIVVDRFSIKQVYYYADESKFAFASEVKALLAAGIPANVDQVKVLEYQLLRRTFGVRTLFKGINRIPAGSILTLELKTAKVTIRSWYSIFDKLDSARFAEYNDLSINKLTGIGEELLRQSVDSRLISDAPLGIMCSGGVDSSLVAALAVTQLDKSRRAAIFTAGVPERDKDETAYARSVCDYLNIDHQVFTLASSTFLPRLPQAIYQNDEPLTFGNALPLFGTCDLAKNEGVKVLLTGEGADELFGGYKKYGKFMLYHKLRKLANLLPRKGYHLHSQIEEIMDTWKLIGNGRYLQKKSPIDIFPGVRKRLELENELFKKFVSLQGAGKNRRVAAFMAADIYDYLGKLLVRQDRMGLWASIECRVPFLDHRVVEFALHLPVKHKLGFVADKILLRRIAKKHLPPNIAKRPKKGFKGPSWGYVNSPIFKNGFYESVFGIPPPCGTSENSFFNVRQEVWKLLNIELWGRIFVWNQAPQELSEKFCDVRGAKSPSKANSP